VKIHRKTVVTLGTIEPAMARNKHPHGITEASLGCETI
jgi:hypothetical protein